MHMQSALLLLDIHLFYKTYYCMESENLSIFNNLAVEQCNSHHRAWVEPKNPTMWVECNQNTPACFNCT